MTGTTNDWIGTAIANGRYVITAKLGEGGMGAVYRAQDRNIDADVVIKVPLHSMVTDSEFSRRFKDEIRSLVKLSHPHVVKVTDVGEWDGLPFAVMQFLPGGSLEDRRMPAGDRPAQGLDRLDRRGRQCAGLRALAGLYPPGREAGQHPLRRPGARLPRRLRRRQGADLGGGREGRRGGA